MSWMGYLAIILPCAGLIGVGYLYAHLYRKERRHDRQNTGTA